MAMELHAFINDWLKSWTGNNPDNLLTYYADNALYIDPANPKGIIGKENLSGYFSKLLLKNPNWVWTAEEIIPTNNGCTLKWKAQIPVSEKTIFLYGLDIVEITDGKITRNEVYFDRTPWMAAIQANR